MSSDHLSTIVKAPEIIMNPFARRLVGHSLTAACIFTLIIPASAGDYEKTLESVPQVDEEKWVFGASLNAWGPVITGTSVTGASIDIGLDDIVDSLNFAFMGTFAARKGRWGVATDLLYMDLETTTQRQVGPASISADIDLKAWVITPVVGYEVFKGSWGTMDVLAGARYLYLKESTGLQVRLPRRTNYSQISSKGTEWAGVVGVRGQIDLSEKWYMPYYFDVGTGGPDLTWQAFGGIGYRFNCWDLTLGYRYLKWEFDSSSSLSDLAIGGPMLGAKFTF